MSPRHRPCGFIDQPVTASNSRVPIHRSSPAARAVEQCVSDCSLSTVTMADLPFCVTLLCGKSKPPGKPDKGARRGGPRHGLAPRHGFTKVCKVGKPAWNEWFTGHLVAWSVRPGPAPTGGYSATLAAATASCMLGTLL